LNGIDIPTKDMAKAKKKARRDIAKPSGKGFSEFLRKPLGSQCWFNTAEKIVLDEADINYAETFS
jgi:hypothetical protein